MTTITVPVEAVIIRDAPSLDPICVFWMDVGPGEGHCTITCYGAAWTAYFGSMSGLTIREFFAQADTDYLVAKMGNTAQLKATKRDHAYLGRIIDWVKESIAENRRAV